MPHRKLLHHIHINRELSEIYLSFMIRSFCISLISIFVPVFFYQQGFPLKAIFGYYVINAFLITIGVPFATKLVGKIGFKRSMMISAPFQIIMLILLQMVNSTSFPIYYIAIFQSITTLLYWPAYEMDFAKSSDKKNRSSEFAVMKIIAFMMTALAPILGAVIIFFFSYNVLFIAVALMLLVAPLPLFMSKEMHEPFNVKLIDIFKEMRFKRYPAFFSEGILYMAEVIIWPLFIFISLKSVLSVGLINTIMIFLMSLITMAIGRISDNGNKKRLMRVGSFIHSLSWFLRTLIQSISYFAAISAFSGVTYMMVHIPYSARFYNRASKKNMATVIAGREMVQYAGRLFIMLLLYLTSDFLLAFIVTGISTISFIFF